MVGATAEAENSVLQPSSPRVTVYTRAGIVEKQLNVKVVCSLLTIRTRPLSGWLEVMTSANIWSVHELRLELMIIFMNRLNESQNY